MKWIALLAPLLVILPSSIGAQGTLETLTIYSELLEMNRDIGIYLPEGYDPDGIERYPVVYFLHGARTSWPIYWTYFQMQSSLDDLIATGQIEPLIMVTPDGLVGPYAGSYWTNSELYGPFEDFVTEELVAYMDTNYQTLQTRAFRAVQGLSMGGYGAMKLGLKNPETFRALASHSGANELFIDLEMRRPFILSEYPAGPPYAFHPDSGSFSELLFSQAGAYSPNLTLPPWFVDLPLDEWGEIVPSVMARWLHHNPAHLATLLPPYPWPGESDLDIYFDCGTQDENQLHYGNCALADSLSALGIEYMFQSFVGTHINLFHERFRIGVAHLDSVMWGKGIYFSGASPMPETSVLTLKVSSPAVGKVQLCYDVPFRSAVRLGIYDPAGRLVRFVQEGAVAPGPHLTTWDICDLTGRPVAPGVYFARLGVKDGTGVTRRVVVLRR